MEIEIFKLRTDPRGQRKWLRLYADFHSKEPMARMDDAALQEVKTEIFYSS